MDVCLRSENSTLLVVHLKVKWEMPSCLCGWRMEFGSCSSWSRMGNNLLNLLPFLLVVQLGLLVLHVRGIPAKRRQQILSIFHTLGIRVISLDTSIRRSVWLAVNYVCLNEMFLWSAR